MLKKQVSGLMLIRLLNLTLVIFAIVAFCWYFWVYRRSTKSLQVVQLQCKQVPQLSVKGNHIDLLIIQDHSRKIIYSISYLGFRNEQPVWLLNLPADGWVYNPLVSRDPFQLKFLPRIASDECQLIQSLLQITGLPVFRFYIVDRKDGVLKTNEEIKSIKVSALVQQFENKQAELARIPVRFTQDIVLEDGTKKKTLDLDKLFKDLQKYTQIPDVLTEGLSVEIYNATDKTGYAAQWSKILRSLGFRVVRIGNVNKKTLSDKSSNNVVFIKESLEDSVSANIIQELFPEATFVHERFTNFINTADVVIILLE